MKLDKVIARVSDHLASDERVLAATKAVPRGSAHETILGAAGAVAGGSVTPAAAGVGAVLGTQAAESVGEAGRAERTSAGADVGRAGQILLVITSRRIALFTMSALGRPKALAASVERSKLISVQMGETSLFGQKMPEIQLHLADGGELGFGVAKVNRRDGEAVVAALS